MLSICVDGTDFLGLDESFPQTLTFSSGETIEVMVVPILDDNVFEGNEEFYATLITTDSGVVITEPYATVNIIENDSESTLITNFVSVSLRFTIFS